MHYTLLLLSSNNSFLLLIFTILLLFSKSLSESESLGFYQLNGHPLWPGLRVILYYGVSENSFQAVCKFMEDFQKKHQHEV